MKIALLCFCLSAAALADDGGSAYRIESPRFLKVKKGAAGAARVEVVPAANAHVSPDAPVSLSVTAPSAIKLAKLKFGRADAKETAAHGVAFDVPFTADASDELHAKLNFFICTEKLCEKQSRELAFEVQVE